MDEYRIDPEPEPELEPTTPPMAPPTEPAPPLDPGAPTVDEHGRLASNAKCLAADTTYAACRMMVSAPNAT